MSKVAISTNCKYEFTEGNFEFSFTLICPNLEPDDPFREEFDDRTIDVPCSGGSLWWQAKSKSKIAAVAVFASDGFAVRCDTIDVVVEFRRQGIAQTIHSATSGIFELPVVPSSILSSDAAAFWAGRIQIQI